MRIDVRSSRLLIGLMCAQTMLAGPCLARKRVPVAVPVTVTVPVPSDPKATLALIDAALTDDRIAAAQSRIATAHGRAPEVELALRQAECARGSGLLDDAAVGFSKLVSDPVVGGRALAGLGITELRRGHDAAAIRAIDQAVARDPGFVRAWIARGVAADRAHDWATADNAYARALALDPASDTALVNRGYSRLLRGAYAEGASDLQAAVRLRPTSVTAQTNLRLALALAGNKAAFRGSNKATLPHDLNTVGFAAMARGDYSVAESLFNRAMELSPAFDHTAWDNLQYLKQMTQRPDPARPTP